MNLNIYQLFNSFHAATAVEKYPFFELAHVMKAVEQPTAKHNHQAAILLQNNLWFQYLVSENKKTNSSSVASDNIAAKIEHVEEVKVTTVNDIFSAISEKEAVLADLIESPDTLVGNSREEIAKAETAAAAQVIETEQVVTTTEAVESLTEIVNEERNIVESSVDNEKEFGDLPKLKNTDSLKSLLSDIKKPTLAETDNNDPIELDPFHAVDYFASQGIKAGAAATVDRLTVQLKSFTQWLKTMKKVEALSTKIETIEELNIHNNVVSLAEDSIKKNDILTENMVEVLVAQGKTNAAIKLLEKLSLQDPTKSTYFATQIENLKHS